MAIVSDGCQECLLIWGSSGGSYMEQPPGYVAQETKAYRLKKAIYELK